MVWDKDSNQDLDLVVAAANLRAHVFGISLKSKFDIKCKKCINDFTIICSVILLAMAGNIIPAIATTNAVIAGLIVMEALKILGGEFNKCKTVRQNVLQIVIVFFRPIFLNNPILVKDC